MTPDRPLVVHVVYRLAVGGLENGVVNLVNELPRDSWRHAIVSMTEIDAAFARRLARRDVELIELHKRPGHGWSLYPAIWSHLRRLAPTIVHTRNLAALELVPAAWAAGVPVRIHGEHGVDALDVDGSNIRRRRIRRLYRPFVTRYVALSPALATYLAGPVGVAASRIEQIYNGVDAARFAPAPASTRIEGCPFDPARHRIVGTVGRFDAVKNHVGLVRAFAAMLAARPELRDVARLAIVGTGPERPRIDEALAETGLRHLTWLPGERDDIPNVLRGMHVYVLPSLGEGVSNTILEAMATALPVVATHVGANAELVAADVTGRIVPPGDERALAVALAGYLGDPALADAHGRAGRHRIEQRFTLQRMVERYAQLYRSLADDAASRGRRTPRLTGHAPN